MASIADAAGESGLFTDGDWILSENMTADGTVGVIQLKHVGIGEFYDKDFQFISDSTFNDLGCTAVRPGDVLISRMADPIGRACIVPRLPFPVVTAVDVSILRVDESVADSRFIMHLCNSQLVRNRIARAARGTTRSRITRTELGEIEIPLPSLSEQRRIAAGLEQADRLRRNRRYALELTDAFLPAAFLELFGDPISNRRGYATEPIDDCCERFIDYRGRTPEYSAEGVPHVTAACIKEHEIQWAAARRVTEVTYAAYMTRGLPVRGDVILTTEAPLGETAVIKIDKTFSVAQRLLLIRPGPRVHSDYLCHLLSHRSFRPQLIRFATGSTVKGISSESFRAIPIPLPPLTLQQRFSEQVERIERLRAVQRESLRQAEHLFASLLQRAFSVEPGEVLSN
jgi:type I restriction enzyme, S subunit